MIKNADEMRAAKLLKRAENAATDGNAATTRSYETLIEHEKSKAQWRKMQFYLNKGDTEPLIRLLVKEQGITKVPTDGEDIPIAIIKHNIKHFFAAEKTPLGKGIYLHDVISPHGTSKFCDRFLDGGLGEADKEVIHYVEAYELLQYPNTKPYSQIFRL